MQKQGVTCVASNILVTAGAQQAIDLLAQLLIDEGDTVLVQPDTYPGALQVFRMRGARIESLDGKQPIPYESSNENVSKSRKKLIYAMTDFQNPTGQVLTLEGRAALLATTRQHGALLVEDSPYRDIQFSGSTPLPTLLEMDCRHASIDAANALFIGSFSKIIAPGLRVGWIVGPKDIISQLTLLRQGSDLQPSTLSQEIVARQLTQGLDAHVERVRTLYRERRDAMLAALETHLSQHGTWTVPDGGFFIWVSLNDDIDAQALLQEAFANGVAYVHGSEFRYDGGISSDLRLSFSSVDADHMDEAIRRLAETIVQHEHRASDDVSRQSR